jgi:hypothetical protein
MEYIYCQPVFEREYLSDDMLKEAKTDVMKYIINAIESGRYVVCCVNEYYIPDREAYRAYSFIHNILIYGYDSLKKEFLTIGYNNKGKYKSGVVTYKEMKSAMPRDITMLRVRASYEYKIHPDRVKDHISEYLGEKPVIPTGSYPEEGRYVGIHAIEKLIEYVETLKEKEEFVDLRPFSILLEHKILMNERFKIMGVKSFELDQYSEIVKMAEALKNRVGIYNVRSSKEDILKIISLLNNTLELEKSLLKKFVTN